MGERKFRLSYSFHSLDSVPSLQIVEYRKNNNTYCFSYPLFNGLKTRENALNWAFQWNQFLPIQWPLKENHNRERETGWKPVNYTSRDFRSTSNLCIFLQPRYFAQKNRQRKIQHPHILDARGLTDRQHSCQCAASLWKIIELNVGAKCKLCAKPIKL